MAAHIEVGPCAVGEEHVARPTPRHHPAEQIARHLVGAQPPLAAQREGDPVLVLEPEDPPLHRCNLPPPKALPRARQLRCPNGYRRLDVLCWAPAERRALGSGTGRPGSIAGTNENGRRRVGTRRLSARRLREAGTGRALRPVCGLNAARCADRRQTEVVMTSNVESALEMREFHVDIPDEALHDLRRRIAATNWPEKETVTDQSQGVPLEMIQTLARYWATDYDWRRCEAALGALPQFITQIDGLDIHFIHVRSQHEDALPVIVNHGWPGSIIEQLKIVDRLTDPTAYGASASDAFHVVVPSMPGYGFSGKPTSTGWGPERMGRAWDELMKRLGYTSYVAQGGDWGAFVVDLMGVQAPAGLLAIHTNYP